MNNDKTQKINEILTIPIRTKLAIFAALMRTDMKLWSKKIKDKFIDSMLWGTLTLAVATFVFPLLGLKNFGVLQIASVIITVIGFEIYWQLFNTTDELCQKGHSKTNL